MLYVMEGRWNMLSMHFVLEFEQDRCWLLERVKGIVGAEEWMNGFEEGDDDSRVSLYYQGEEWT